MRREISQLARLDMTCVMLAAGALLGADLAFHAFADGDSQAGWNLVLHVMLASGWLLARMNALIARAELAASRGEGE
jgi:hypothetical protein